jgi:hypothetical protein
MVAGSSGNLTTNLLLTFSKTSLSVSEVTKEIARPLVPKRPALINKQKKKRRNLPSDSVQISVFALGHVVVNDNVDSLKINTSAKNISRHHDRLFVSLESLV